MKPKMPCFYTALQEPNSTICVMSPHPTLKRMPISNPVSCLRHTHDPQTKAIASSDSALNISFEESHEGVLSLSHLVLLSVSVSNCSNHFVRGRGVAQELLC